MCDFFFSISNGYSNKRLVLDWGEKSEANSYFILSNSPNLSVLKVLVNGLELIADFFPSLEIS